MKECVLILPVEPGPKGHAGELGMAHTRAPASG